MSLEEYLPLLFWGKFWKDLVLIFWIFDRIHQWSHLVLDLLFLGSFFFFTDYWFSLITNNQSFGWTFWFLIFFSEMTLDIVLSIKVLAKFILFWKLHKATISSENVVFPDKLQNVREVWKSRAFFNYIVSIFTVLQLNSLSFHTSFLLTLATIFFSYIQGVWHWRFS